MLSIFLAPVDNSWTTNSEWHNIFCVSLAPLPFYGLHANSLSHLGNVQLAYKSLMLIRCRLIVPWWKRVKFSIFWKKRRRRGMPQCQTAGIKSTQSCKQPRPCQQSKSYKIIVWSTVFSPHGESLSSDWMKWGQCSVSVSTATGRHVSPCGQLWRKVWLSLNLNQLWQTVIRLLQILTEKTPKYVSDMCQNVPDIQMRRRENRREEREKKKRVLFS